MTKITAIKIIAINKQFGADISGIDLANINSAEFKMVYQAWLDYGVLRIRNQQLDEAGLQRFSQRFGPLEAMPGYASLPDKIKAKVKNKYVLAISNIIENGRPIGGLGNAEASWHSDMTYTTNPPPASVLLGVEIPTKGGDTWFANQYAAYNALPQSLIQRIENLTINHDAAHTSVGDLRRGYEEVSDASLSPGTAHPIIKTHPETGRKCLYLGRREWAYVPGLPLDQSEALLGELWQYAHLPENIVKQQWHVGDVIIWDNRCVLHRRDDIDPNDRRLLRRCQVLQATQEA